MKVVIALGANLEDPRKQVSIAIDKVRDIVKVEKVSSLLRPHRSAFRIISQIT